MFWLCTVGCGTLNLARHLLTFLNNDESYHCVEPNLFLVESSLVVEKPRNIHVRNDFCAELTIDKKFDVVVGHSVMSHAGFLQWKYFFTSLNHHLKSNGVAFVSVCLCGACETVPRQYETNEEDVCLDSNDEEWVYPYVSYWKPSTLRRMAKEYGLHMIRRNDLREIMIVDSPADNHDWVSFSFF